MSGGGYFATGPCCLCRVVFVFNPELVPSIPVDGEGRVTPDGVKRPLCRECVDKINAFRESQGERPVAILAGAYEPSEGFPP